jgi:hypothetical protein
MNRTQRLIYVSFFSTWSLFFSSCPARAASENINITTYYPSPVGVYKTLRVYPGPRPASCHKGEIVYHNGTIPVAGYYACDESNNWQLLGSGGGGSSFWAAVGGNSNGIRNLNSGNVTVGIGARDSLGIVGALDVRSDTNPPITWGNSTAIYGTLDYGANYARVTAGPGKNLIFAGDPVDPSTHVTLTPAGNLGIGIPDPLEKLTVKQCMEIGDDELRAFGLKLASQAYGIPQSMHIKSADSPISSVQTIWNGNWTGTKTGNALTANAMYHIATIGTLSYNQIGYINTAGAFGSGNLIPLMTFSGNITGAIQPFIGIGTIPSPSPLFTLQVAGNIGPDDIGYNLGSLSKAWKNIYYYVNPLTSDVRLKTNITDTPLGIDFIRQLRPVQFNWKEHNDGTHHGLIAQELEKTVTDKAIEFAGVRRDAQSGLYSVDYLELIAPLLKSIQEHQQKIGNLRARLKELERRNN